MFTHRSPGRLRAALALLVLALVAALAGCGTSSSDTAGTGPREVPSAKGPIKVPADPQRVVVLNGNLAGYLYDLEAKVVAADPRLLGVPNKPGEFPTGWAEDAKAQGTQAVQSGDNINLEFIAAQRPDLIIGGGQGYPGQQSVNAYDQLSAIAPTVLMPTETTNWQDQLRFIAETVNKPANVDTLIANYHAKLTEAKSKIKPPAGATVVFQSIKSQKPTVFVPTAALPALLAEVGFTLDTQVEAKAGNPAKEQSADFISFSPELINTVIDAPVLFTIPLSGGRSLEELRADPLYASLPSFQQNKVFELPATSSRPDYRTVMTTLDLLVERFK
ncbi:Fe2+-enterobactin ABC transporter substrate-binding protein [Nocardia neocaledoniensis NBRC 108232]|uniref:Iron complex transport system substrate-binding protein n=2 Tax=Nocardia neocaledoniensis TaxID=236511 RepID=A0A317NPX5_9NOCA|nr:iron complex transport system substrate-binding protein [Nocardia neocaledoniensis]GEM32286.1 Fe2+-enterobactin ABC transporter substrate-binding protein [Nocardia neocaledoniensis NBRC 108232]